MVLKQKAKPETNFQSSEINAHKATELSSKKIQPECNKYCRDTANELKQGLLDIIEISSGTAIDSDKTYDSQETRRKDGDRFFCK